MGCPFSGMKFIKVSMHMDKFCGQIGMKGKYQYPEPTQQQLEEGLDMIILPGGYLEQAREYEDMVAKGDPVRERFFVLERFHVMCHLTRLSHLEKWRGCKDFQEADLVAAITEYQVGTDSVIYREVGGKQNWLNSGMFLYLLGLVHGSDLHAWHTKALDSWRETGIAASRKFSMTNMTFAELGDLTLTALPVLIMLGKREMAAELCSAVGFAWDDVTFDAWWKVVGSVSPKATFPKETWYTVYRFLLFLSLPDDSVPQDEVKAWLPAPAALAELNKAWLTQVLGAASVLNLGARAYEKLGNDALAAEAAGLGLSTQTKACVTVDCHALLGRVASRSDDNSSMATHFQAACHEAGKANLWAMQAHVANECCDLSGDFSTVRDQACAQTLKNWDTIRRNT